MICLQGTKCENAGNLNFTRRGHVESPHQRHWQTQEHEVCDHVLQTVYDDPGVEIDALSLDRGVPAALHREALENRQGYSCYAHACNHASDEPKGNVQPTIWKNATIKEDEGKFHGNNTCCIGHLRCNCDLGFKAIVSTGA